MNPQGRLTSDGQRATRLPVHPRFASLLLLAERLGELPVGCLLAACLGEPDGQQGRQSDELLEDLRRFALDLQEGAATHSPRSQAFRQLADIFKVQSPRPENLETNTVSSLLTRAYPDRVAFSRQRNGDYLMSSGRGAQIKAGSHLRNAAWLAVSDISQNDRGGAIIRRALPLNESWLNGMIAATAWQEDVFWDESGQRVSARRVKRLGAIELCAEAGRPAPEQRIQILCDAIRTSGENLLNWDKDSRQLMARINLLHQTLGPPWPALDCQELMQQPETWLAAYLSGINNGTQLKKLDLQPALKGLLGWQEARQLDQFAPLRMAVPSGEMMKIDYSSDGASLPVKLQQLFGLAETPAICQGQVALKLQLLSPAGRPLAVTSDLRSFWDNVYPEVQKEMKGRYPKHPWPDNPWQAVPTRKTRTRNN